MIRLAAASAALAAAILSAGAASAQDYRIAFGDLDLGSTDGAAQFDRRVDQVAQRLCSGGAPLPDAQCVRRVRVEATRLLPNANREDYARARTDRVVVRTSYEAR